MKVISRKEFQDAYISPTEEQTARIQAKLDSIQQEPEERRHVLQAKPRLAFIMAALLVIAGITAIAASTIRYKTTWGGEVREYEESDLDKERDTLLDGIPAELEEKMNNALEKGLFPNILGPQPAGFSCYPSESAESLEDLVAMLDAEGFPHPTPLIPENCSFTEGKVTYGIISDYKKNLVSSTLKYGYTLDVYSVEPDNKYIQGYSIFFSDKNDPDKIFEIDVISSPVPGGTFYFASDDPAGSTQTLSIPGMEEALIVHADGYEALHMQQNISSSGGTLAKKLRYYYLIITANGAVDDVIKLYSAWEE